MLSAKIVSSPHSLGHDREGIGETYGYDRWYILGCVRLAEKPALNSTEEAGTLISKVSKKTVSQCYRLLWKCLAEGIKYTLPGKTCEPNKGESENI